MNNCTILQKIEDEYFVRMMIPSIRELAQPFEDEESVHLRQLIMVRYPMMKKGEEVQRITMTAANTGEEVDRLIQAFQRIRPMFE